MQCSRHSYLPLLLDELKDNFVSSVLASDELESLTSPVHDWWFELDTSQQDEEPHGNGDLMTW